MSEKLIIRNYGPIKDVELDLKKFNVIIGEQATGKSTIAKVLSVCRNFSFIIDDIVGVVEPAIRFDDGLREQGVSEFIKKDSFISYDCEHYTFSASREEYLDTDSQTGEVINQYGIFKTSIIPVSQKFKKLLKELEVINPNNALNSGYGFLDIDWKIPTSFLQKDVPSVIDVPFYLPTERGLQSIFSLGKNSIQNISDALFNQLAELDLVAKNFKNETPIEPLEISYKNVDGRGYVKKNNEDQYYSLYNGASGFKIGYTYSFGYKVFQSNKKRENFYNRRTRIKFISNYSKRVS